MSKTYEALKKAEAERKAAQEKKVEQQPQGVEPPSQPAGVAGESPPPPFGPAVPPPQFSPAPEEQEKVEKNYEFVNDDAPPPAERQTNGRYRPVAVALNPPPHIEEQYQRLYTTMVVRSPNPQPIQTIMIVGAHHGDGVTTTASLFARMLAKSRSVLLIDANLRTPALADVFHVRNKGGFVDFLSRKVSLDGAVSATEIPNLFVMTSGSGPLAPPYLFESGYFDELLAQLRTKFNYIIFDAAPLGLHLDATFLASRVDGVLLLIKAEATMTEEAQVMKKQLEAVGAKILGVVMNQTKDYVPKVLHKLLS